MAALILSFVLTWKAYRGVFIGNTASFYEKVFLNFQNVLSKHEEICWKKDSK